MPPYVNETEATATDIGALPAGDTPAVISQALTGLYHGYLWWKYTAIAGDTVLGVYCQETPGPVTNLRPQFEIRLAGTDYLGGLYGAEFRQDRGPVQFPVTAGTTYYVKVNPFTDVAASFQLEVYRHVNADAPEGSLLIPADAGYPATILSATDAVAPVLRFLAGSDGLVYIIHAANRAIWRDPAVGFRIYDTTTFAQIATVSLPHGIVTGVSSHFLVVDFIEYGSPPPSTLRQVFFDGTIGTTWALPFIQVYALGASVAGTLLYYYAADPDFNAVGSSVIRRFNLTSGTPMTDFLPARGYVDAFAIPRDYAVMHNLLVLADNTVLVGYWRQTLAYVVPDGLDDIFIEHRSAAGALLRTYNFGRGYFAVADGIANSVYGLLCLGPDDQTSFWLWQRMQITYTAGGDGFRSRFTQVRVSDGAILADLWADQFFSGMWDGAPVHTPIARFGHAYNRNFATLATRLGDVVFQACPCTDDPWTLGP